MFIHFEAPIYAISSLTHARLILKISAHVRRIEAVEKDLKALAATTADKEELGRLRSETKKLYVSLYFHVTSLRPSLM